MVDEEIRTIPLALESTVNGVTASIPWAQRQANGAIIVRVHLQSVRHSAGEMLLNETDLVALDAEERPLRTQVRRFWGYSALGDVTAAHLQTARFDVGFRLDMVATAGRCGLTIAIIRTFRPGEGPKALGGPWVFSFRVADEQELAALARLEAARIEAAQREQVQREQAQREAAERDAAQREAARLARARAEAERSRVDAERSAAVRVERPAGTFEPRRDQREQSEGMWRSSSEDAAGGRGRRSSRFGQSGPSNQPGQSERSGRDESRREQSDPIQPAPEQQLAASSRSRPPEPAVTAPADRPAIVREPEQSGVRQIEPVPARQFELAPRGQEDASPPAQADDPAPRAAVRTVRTGEPRSRPSRAGLSRTAHPSAESKPADAVADAAVTEPVAAAPDTVVEPALTPASEPLEATVGGAVTTDGEAALEQAAARTRAVRSPARRPSRARKPAAESTGGGEAESGQAELHE